jgi:flagellar hook assembly protein FlgD
VQGRLIRTLVDTSQPDGTYKAAWDGTSEAGVIMPSGLYLYRLETEGGQQTRALQCIQ